MKNSTIVRFTSIGEIEEHLLRLGGGNHEDNMRTVRNFPNRYLLSLTEGDFKDLVFLETPKLAQIVPALSDRRLAAVAARALALPSSELNLGPNWDLTEIVEQWIEAPKPPSALLLRDASHSETRKGQARWYLQDGSHRALAQCMAVLKGYAYCGQLAYCVTNAVLT